MQINLKINGSCRICIVFLLLVIMASTETSAVIGNDSSGNEVRYEISYISINSTDGTVRMHSFGDYLSSLIMENAFSGWFSSLEYNFFKPNTPDLHLPLNNTYVNTTTNTFDWSNTTDTEKFAVSYLFEIWNDSSATDIHFVNYSIAETANTTKTEATINGDGVFYWRVAANDTSKNSSFSELRVITVDTTLPAAFSLTSPADGTSSTDTSPILQWNATAETNLDNYTIEISTLEDFSVINQTEVTETNSLTNWSSALTADTYYWRVTAVDRANNQQTSENNLSFTVQASESTTATVATSETSSGGGTKPFTLNVLAPEGIVLTANNEIKVPLLVINPSTIRIRGINLAARSDEQKMALSLDRTYLSELNPGQQEKLTLTIATKDIGIGSYGIIIDASAASPSFTDTTRIFANLLERTEGEKDVLDQIEFAKQLFNGNPQCLDLSEYITGAEAALQKGDVATASSLAQNAVEACNKLLAQKETQFNLITTAATFTDRVIGQLQTKTSIIILSQVLGLIILIFIAYKYRKSRKMKRKSQRR